MVKDTKPKRTTKQSEPHLKTVSAKSFRDGDELVTRGYNYRGDITYECVNGLFTHFKPKKRAQ